MEQTVSGPSDDDGTTPLTAEEQQALIPPHITLRTELNEVEQQGVLAAIVWAFERRRPALLTEDFICSLHQRMFGDVWRWAGEYRTRARNVGGPHWEIRPDIRNLIDDARVWVDRRSYPPDELAIRFHHRLVAIHPFPNGNGRLSRLMADLLIVEEGGPRFSWGGTSLAEPGDTRKRYIAALKAADAHDMAPLIAFARS